MESERPPATPEQPTLTGVAPGPQAPPPPATGQQPTPAPYGAAYCRGCGHLLNPQAAICVSCGVPTGVAMQAAPSAPPKSKTTAVVLAVLFGLFAWIYTYKRDAWKFWLNLALAILTIGIWGLVAWVWAIIDIAVRPTQWYEAFPNG
jgi:hypothetical protein